MYQEKDYFGRVIKDGDWLFRAMNAGRSYTMGLVLAVETKSGIKYLGTDSFKPNMMKNNWARVIPERTMIVDDVSLIPKELREGAEELAKHKKLVTK